VAKNSSSLVIIKKSAQSPKTGDKKMQEKARENHSMSLKKDIFDVLVSETISLFSIHDQQSFTRNLYTFTVRSKKNTSARTVKHREFFMKKQCREFTSTNETLSRGVAARQSNYKWRDQ
jgi:hypothetical protein